MVKPKSVCSKTQFATMLCFINEKVEAGAAGQFTRALLFMLLHGYTEAEADADAVRQTR